MSPGFGATQPRRVKITLKKRSLRQAQAKARDVRPPALQAQQSHPQAVAKKAIIS